MKQYQPKKPVKRDFKVWCLADALNGYFCDFDVYVGATGESPELLLGERVVLKLIQGHHHQLYMENVFTSFSSICYPSLSPDLCCWDLRTN